MTTCSRCHRPIHTASSIAIGMGPTCARRARQEKAAAALAFKAATVTKARQDMEDGAIQPTSRRTSTGNRIYVAVSSDGNDRYLTTETACTCPAGHRSKHVCRHRAAATLLSA